MSFVFNNFVPQGEYNVVGDFGRRAVSNLDATNPAASLASALQNAHSLKTGRLQAIVGNQFGGMSAHYNVAI